MGNDHLRRFFVIIFELFIVLKIYDIWRDKTNFPPLVFLVFLFIGFWIVNYILDKLSLGASWPTLVVAKVLTRTHFSEQWFGFFLFAAVVAGFFISKLFTSIFIYSILFLVGLYFVYEFFQKKKYNDYGYYLAGFLLGLAFGTKFTNHPFIIFIFLLGFVLTYFLVGPGEARPF